MIKQMITKVRFWIALVVLIGANIVFLPQAFATTYLSQPMVILSNMNASGTSAVVFEFKTSASNTGTTLSINFSTYTGGSNGSVAASPSYATSLGTSDCKTLTGATAYVPGSPVATGSSGLITFSGVTAYTASTAYCGVLTGAAVTNPTATGIVPVTITAGVDAASQVETDIITNDQVVVSAIVPYSYTLTLGGNTDSFTGNLASGSVGLTTGVTASVTTNAQHGWSLYALDSNTGLTSGTAGHTIASTSVGSNTSLSAGTEGYLTGLPAAGITQGTGGGTTSATAAYASNGTNSGAGLNTNYNKIASSTGTAINASVTVKEFAAISGTTQPGSDYTDTITLVGAGTF